MLAVIYLNFEKAFDTVLLSKLLGKMRKYAGISEERVRWVEAGCRGRSLGLAEC